MNSRRKSHRIWLKAIAVVVVCLFMVDSVSWSIENTGTLAPKILLSDGQNRARLQASLICRLIEERASYGRSIEDIYIDDILLWAGSSEEAFEGCRFETLPDEIRIYLPDSDLCIRYYDPDPDKNRTLVPFTDWGKTETAVINERMNRQFVHMTQALPEKAVPKSAVMEWILKKERQGADLADKEDLEGLLYSWEREKLRNTVFALSRNDKGPNHVFDVDLFCSMINGERGRLEAFLGRTIEVDTGYRSMEHRIGDKIKEMTGIKAARYDRYLIAYQHAESEADELLLETSTLVSMRGARNDLVFNLEVFLGPEFEWRHSLLPAMVAHELGHVLLNYTARESRDMYSFHKGIDNPYIGNLKYDFYRYARFFGLKGKKHRDFLTLLVGELREVVADWVAIQLVGRDEFIRAFSGNLEHYYKHFDKYDISTHAHVIALSRLLSVEDNEVFCKFAGKVDEVCEDKELLEQLVKDIEDFFKGLEFKGQADEGDGETRTGEIEEPAGVAETLAIEESSLREYLESENFFYPILPPEAQESVVRRIMDLQGVIVETEDGQRMSILGFARYILSDLGYEDKLEHILAFGSYVFSRRPGDVDVYFGLSGDPGNTTDFLDTITKLNNSDKLKSGAYRIIFPEGSESPVEKVHFAFIGQGVGNEDNRDEYLAKLYLFSGVFVYGSGIYQNQIRSDIFEGTAAAVIDDLCKRAFEQRKSEDLESKKAMYRILQAALILGRINRDSGVKAAKPERIHECIDKYLSEEDPIRRAEQAVLELREYMEPEKANSIFAYFLAEQTEPLTEVEDEELEVLQMNAINCLVYLTAQGNLQAYKSLSKFKDVKSAKVKHYLFEHAQIQLLGIMKLLGKDIGGHPPHEVMEIIESFVGGGLMMQQEKGYHIFTEGNTGLISALLAESRNDILLRVPIEAIETAGIENVEGFLNAFQEAPNGYVELYYMSGTGEVSGSVYQRYNLEKEPVPKDFARTRHNTITLFPVLKGEEISLATVRTRLGDMDLEPTDTIMSPVGLQHDPTGLIRGTVFGLRMMHIARQKTETGKVDEVFVKETVDQYRELCKAQWVEEFDLTDQDMIDMAIGDINQLIRGLRKLIKLLPITPIDAEELRRIYEHARQVLMAA